MAKFSNFFFFSLVGSEAAMFSEPRAVPPLSLALRRSDRTTLHFAGENVINCATSSVDRRVAGSNVAVGKEFFHFII